MKVSLRPLLLASAALLAPQMSSATVLLAVDDFSVSTNPITTASPGNYIAPGYSATMTGGALVNSGGSDDGTFGPSSLLPTASADASNGNAWLVNTNLLTAVLSFTGNGTSSTLLGALLYDAATSTGRQNLEISYKVNNGATTTVSQIVLEADDFGAGTSNDFGDYILPLGITLGASDVIQFTFKSIGVNGLPGDSIYLDNLAIVPEPGSLLALGCLMGGGAFFRSRRRRA